MAKINFHAGATLYETPSKLYIQSRDELDEALVINRQTGEVSHNEMFSVDFLPYNAQTQLIYGIVGIKQLVFGSYLIVITDASLVGYLSGHSIYKIAGTRIIPIINTDNHSGASRGESSKWEQIYLQMLESVLKIPSFYFSYTYDLTNSLQRNYAIEKELENSSTGLDVYQQCDQRFHWNRHLLTSLDELNPRIQRYRLTTILGFISINENALGHGLNWMLISRRSTKRAGTRFNTRGIDWEGNVANFVETEQIVERSDTKASFVQIRGSIPLYWSQKPGYKYKPPIVIDGRANHEQAMEKHLNDIISRYGDVTFACLIDQRGHEGTLAHEFGQLINRMLEYYKRVTYHYFDFHRECSKMRWHRLNILLERLEPEIRNHGYFSVRDAQVTSNQTGVVRSNCIDSLDRTNVIQSMIAQFVLQQQLSHFGANIGALRLSEFPIFMDTFKNIWADNADALSIQYAGTPALKTDFTRTGQRTHTGMLKDGFNSLTRYVSNNYLDGYRQDAIGLFLGTYVHYPSPMYRPLELATYTSMLPLTFVMMTLVALYFYFRWDPMR